MKTRDKILQTAIKLFNERGYGAVNLEELAQVMSISRGNLTYHFKSKEDLLEAIADEMWVEIAREKEKTLQVPSFQNMHKQTKLYHSFQKQYAFVFLDRHVQNHSIVKKQFKAMIEKTINDFHQMIAMGMQIGTVKQETIPGTYRSLALSVWMVSFYWLSQQTTRDINDSEGSEKIIWGLILPHLTNKGITGFKEYFGEAFYKKLGKPFDVNQYALIKF